MLKKATITLLSAHSGKGGRFSFRLRTIDSDMKMDYNSSIKI